MTEATKRGFTPGPWVLGDRYKEEKNIVIYGIGWSPIAHIPIRKGKPGEAEANAALLLAAPDLYAALEEGLRRGYDGSGDYIAAFEAWKDIARAALEKARGS